MSVESQLLLAAINNRELAVFRENGRIVFRTNNKPVLEIPDKPELQVTRDRNTVRLETDQIGFLRIEAESESDAELIAETLKVMIRPTR